jgi:hypothetical protein
LFGAITILLGKRKAVVPDGPLPAASKIISPMCRKNSERKIKVFSVKWQYFSVAKDLV